MKKTKFFLPVLACLALGMGLMACQNQSGDNSGGNQQSSQGQKSSSSAQPKIKVTAAGDKKTLLIGEKVQLTADPADVTWQSSDAAIASVSESGEVTAVSGGEAIITAKKDGFANGTITITVTRPAATATLDMTEADHYSADGWWSVVMDYGGMSFEQGSGITPVTSNYMDQSNTYIGYFGEGDVETVKFTSNKATQAELVMTLGYASDVTLADVMEVKFNNTAISLAGKTLEGTGDQYGMSFEFIEVSLGKVNLVNGENSLELKIKADGAPYMDELMIYADEQATIALVPSTRQTVQVASAELEVVVGQTVNIQATTQGVSFTSTDEAVCTVNAQGVVTGVKVGTANIRVKKDGMFTAVVAITVRPASVPGQIVLEVEDYIPDGSEISADLPQWGGASVYSGTSYVTTWPAEAEMTINFNADANKTMVLSISGAAKMNMSTYSYEDVNMAEAFEIKVNNTAVNLTGKVMTAPTGWAMSIEFNDLDLGDVTIKQGANTMVVKALVDGPYVDCFKLTPKN